MRPFYFYMLLWENPQPLVNAEVFCSGYAQKQRLTAAKIAAMPWLMRLRNAASAIWWFGRQLAAGETIDLAARIGDLRQLVDWLKALEGNN